MKPQQGLSERYLCRAIDVTLAAKLTLTYGKYYLAMLHRQLAMSEERTTYQQAERQAAMMNQMTIFRSSPADFLRPCGSKRPEVERMHTQEESTDESIATYREFKRLVEEYADEYFVPSVVDEFCKRVLFAPWLTPYPRLTGVLKLSSRSATCTTPSMPMRCCGISRTG